MDVSSQLCDQFKLEESTLPAAVGDISSEICLKDIAILWPHMCATGIPRHPHQQLLETTGSGWNRFEMIKLVPPEAFPLLLLDSFLVPIWNTGRSCLFWRWFGSWKKWELLLRMETCRGSHSAAKPILSMDVKSKLADFVTTSTQLFFSIMALPSDFLDFDSIRRAARADY